MIECTRTGSVEQAIAGRPKIARTLERKTPLRARLAAARMELDEDIIWKPEEERVRNVILKLARAHIAYEQNEPRLENPVSVSFVPLCVMTSDAREEFEASPNSGLWPEVGSRAMHRILVGAEGDYPWIEVQPGRYRYLVATSPCIIRTEVAWD